MSFKGESKLNRKVWKKFKNLNATIPNKIKIHSKLNLTTEVFLEYYFTQVFLEYYFTQVFLEYYLIHGI